MKIKNSEVSLPSEVVRGRIDLADRRAKAGLASSMNPKEKEIIESSLKTAIEEAVGTKALIKAHEGSLKETLKQFRLNRQNLAPASKKEAGQPSAVDGKAII